MPREVVIVGAAVVEENGRYLLTRRLAGTHLEGLWEFPGGKCEEGETVEACVRRELREELGVDAEVGPRLVQVSHAYDERTVELHFFECRLSSAPRPQQGQEMCWVGAHQLDDVRLPEGDRALVEVLRARAVLSRSGLNGNA